MLELIQSYAAAQRIVGKLRIEAASEDKYVWTKLYSVGKYLEERQIELAKSYFGDDTRKAEVA